MILERINGLLATMDPVRANGLLEAVTAWLLIVGVFVMLVMRIEVPGWLQMLFGIAVGAFLGVKSEANKRMP